MSENYKDELQKLVQKHGLFKPEYVTVKSGLDHIPEFITTVTINGHSFRGSFRGQTANTKKNAEKLAALEVLNYIKSYKFNNNQIKTCILIDLDYFPKFDDDITIKELCYDNLDIFVFMSNEHKSTKKKFPNEIIQIITPSNNPEDTKICMSTYLGSLLIKNLYDEYLLATNHDFALTLIKIINDKTLGWDNKKAREINNISQICEK